MTMRAISLFSGAGGFELGMERAGIKTVLQCEIDPVALSVLRRHWPNVPKVEDVRTLDVSVASQYRQHSAGLNGASISHGSDSGVDLIYGGFPCQDLSVAGARGGLGGARSGLWFEFRRIVSELRPRWVVVENVPGLYSSNERRDFATIVEGLTQLGYGVAWRKLDAQFLLVHQRRGRVFFVATYDMGDGVGAERAAKVLSLCEGCGRHSKARSKARKGVAASLRSRSASSGANLPGRGGEDDSNLIPFGAGDVGYALRAEPSASGDKGDGGINTTLVASPLAGHHHRDDLDNDSYVIAETLRGHPRAGSNSVGAITVASTLDTNPMRHIGRGDGSENIVMATLDTHLGDKQWLENQSVGNYGTMNSVGAGVRRLIPVECERLMGWPDDWTRWRDDGKEIPDTHRYRLIGNGVVSTVAEFIGRRLVAINAR